MFSQLGPMELAVVMGIAILLFGKRLPEVGRSLGKGIVEFKKSLRGIEDEFDLTSTSSAPDRSVPPPQQSPPPPVPKFEPPTSAPIAQPSQSAPGA